MRTFNFPIILFLLLISCNTAKKENPGRDTVKDQTKAVTELTNVDIWELLLVPNNAPGKEAETVDYKRDAIRRIVDIIAGDCADKDCGSMVQMQSTSQDRIISVIVKFSLSLSNGAIKEIIRAYDLGSMEKISLGCTHFCYKGESYGVKREVLSATFK